MFCFIVVSGLLAALLGPVAAIKCHDDISLEDVQEYEFLVPHMTSVADFVAYWKHYHQSFIVFGRFTGDTITEGTTITAGLYTDSDDLIHSITIDCDAETWTSHIINNETAEFAVHETGALDTSCEAGQLFDIWLKVQQPFLMNWLYGSQALQYDIHETSFDDGLRRQRKNNGEAYFPVNIRWRSRPTPVPTLRGADQGQKFKLSTTGSAVVTRLAFGKCVAWPEEMSSNCTAARVWFYERSKMDPNDETSDFPGIGNLHFGAVEQKFAPKCRNTVYFDNMQSLVKPDQDSEPMSSYCCCVDMRTGRVYQDDPAQWCQTNLNNSCRLTCIETYEKELWIET